MLEDFHGTAEAIVFPDAWAKLNQTIVADAALLLTGGYSDRDRGEDHAPFIVESARRLEELKADAFKGCDIAFFSAGATRSREFVPAARAAGYSPAAVAGAIPPHPGGSRNLGKKSAGPLTRPRDTG